MLAQPSVITRIDEAALETHPFDHVYLRDLFPASLYRELLRNLPERRHFHELSHEDARRPDGSSARLRFYLYPEQLWRLPAEQRRLWQPLSKLLMSRELQDAFKRKFRNALESRFGRGIDQIHLYPVPIVVRDLPGYRIGIHSDVVRKAITVQFYLPEDDAQQHIGTIFHEGRSGEAAQRTTRMPFLPASGYAFPVQAHASWHSAATVAEADGERRSIMLTYYVQNRPKWWLARRIDRLRSALGFHSSN
ncbi:hypothetical protein [Hydrocarboniphaga sp.]|uniref:hypothetical protein n=1 Tax=Hydrocarboniphaga sp. TaxID=2033016 RepID=UPI003D10F73D